MTTLTITTAEATDLIERCLRTAGFSDQEATTIVDHLIDCELRGLSYGGLPRALTIIERVNDPSYSKAPIETQRPMPSIATVNGGNQVGYLVADHCMKLGIDLAKTHGIAAVTANQTWYTGMFAYYLEQIAAAGLIGVIAGNGPSRVAPHGGTESMFGTNPIAFGFPSDDQPILFDIGTSKLMHAEVLLAQRLGEDLPPDSAFDASGNGTQDPIEAFAGAIAPWGGHKGSGLAIVVQLLGLAAGQGLTKTDNTDCGFFLIAIDPALLPEGDSYRSRVSEYAEAVRKSRPIDPDRPVRMPFDGSSKNRAKNAETGEIVVSEHVYDKLREYAR